MHVISVSRRTDIAAFYSSWFMNRIRAGYCHWVNPFSSQVYRVSLLPQDCIALVFWTRNPRPLMRYLDDLSRRGYTYYFLYTILGYSRPLEARNPDLQAAVRTFKELSSRIDQDRVIWRYDPIIISNITPPEYHIRQFQHIASELSGHTRRCKFSFLSVYDKVDRNLSQLADVELYTLTPSERSSMLSRLGEIALDAGIELQTCCVDDYLHTPSIQRGSCVDIDLLRALTAHPELALKKKPTRALCNCVESVDIGAYDTCLFGCTYCYATNSREAALKRYAAHDPEDTILYRPDGLSGVNLDLKTTAG